MYSREYELVFIVRPDVTDEDIETIKDRNSGIISDRKGHILMIDDWGKRRLAYEIQDYGKGHFVLFNYLGSTEIVDELERTLRIDDSVLRFLTVKLGERIDVDARVAEAAAASEAAAGEAKERAEASGPDTGSEGETVGAQAGA
jgi:small subunit ribosomal protein S6